MNQLLEYFRPGKIEASIHLDLNLRMMPPPEAFPELLFQGGGDEAGLFALTNRLIDEFRTGFNLSDGEAGILSNTALFTVSAYNMLSAKRATGESYAMHPLRVFNRFLGFLGACQADNLFYGTGFDLTKGEGKNIALVTALLALVHDFPEDGEKFRYEFSHTNEWLENTSLKEVAITITQKDTANISPLRFKATNEQVKLFEAGLRALRKPELGASISMIKAAQTQVGQITQLTKRIDYLNTNDLLDFRKLFTLLIGGLKLCDRLDNFSTPAELKNGQFEPMKKEKAEKLFLSTYYFFGELENMVKNIIHNDRLQLLETNRGFHLFNPTRVIEGLLRDKNPEKTFGQAWSKISFPYAERTQYLELYVPHFKFRGSDEITIYEFGYLDKMMREYMQYWHRSIGHRVTRDVLAVAFPGLFSKRFIERYGGFVIGSRQGQIYPPPGGQV